MAQTTEKLLELARRAAANTCTGSYVGGTELTGSAAISQVNPLLIDLGETSASTTASFERALLYAAAASLARTESQFEEALFSDNYLHINYDHNTPVAQTGGIFVTVLPTATQDVAVGQFTKGIAGVSNPSVGTLGSGTFAAGDLVQINGAPHQDGIYEVLSHVGTLLTIRGVGLTATVEPFPQTNWKQTGNGNGALITKVAVAVLRAHTSGIWQKAFGSTVPLVYTPLGSPGDHDEASEISYNNVTSGLAAITVQQAIDELDATLDALGLNEAYHNGRLVTMDIGDIELIHALGTLKINGTILTATGDLTASTTTATKTVGISHPTAGSIRLTNPAVGGLGVVILGDPVGGAGSFPTPSISMTPIGVTSPFGAPGPAIFGDASLWVRGDLNSGGFTELLDTASAFAPFGKPAYLMFYDIFGGATFEHLMVFGSNLGGSGAGSLIIDRPAVGGSAALGGPGFPINVDIVGVVGNPSVNGKAYAFGDGFSSTGAVAGGLAMVSSGFGSMIAGEAGAYLFATPSPVPYTTMLGVDGSLPPGYSPMLFLTTSAAATPTTSPSGLPVRAALAGGRRPTDLPSAVLLGRYPGPPLVAAEEVVIAGNALFSNDGTGADGRIGTAGAGSTALGRPRSVQAVDSLSLGWGKSSAAVPTILELIAVTGDVAGGMPYSRWQSRDGSNYYFWVANDGKIRRHTSAPSADGDGAAITT